MERFKEIDQDVILDTKTNLEWMKNPSKFFPNSMIWEDAMQACSQLEEGWRLPNIDELSSLIDRTQYMPTLPKNHLFSGVQAYDYWSATTYADGYAWGVFLGYGGVYYDSKTNSRYVWPVRGGQC